MSDRDELLPVEPVIHPTPEYETITLRELSIGFASGRVEDLTLYPEDEMLQDAEGGIRVVFKTLQEGDLKCPEFVSHGRAIEWKSIRDITHRRKKGTLRPTPKQLIADYQETRRREAAKRAAGATEE